jgi:DNA topoisomerase-1
VLQRITLDEAVTLLQLPRVLGTDPADGQEIVANNGRYGPYVVKGKDYRSLDREEQLLTITLDEATEIFRQPKVFKRGGRNMATAGPLREFGVDPVSERPVVAKEGRFGVYVTDGETNASIGKGDRIEDMLPERAFELLAVRRETLAAKGGPPRKAGGARKKAAAKRPAKKSTAKSTGRSAREKS